jgi:hypothetical protein
MSATVAPPVDWSFFSMAKYLLTALPEDERVMQGEEWAGLLASLAEAGQLALEVTPAAAVDRASTFRGLLQMLYFGLERTLGSADPQRPVFSRPWPVHLFDYGAGNPDGIYRTVALRDDVTYRIRGRVGNAAFLSFEFFDGVRQTGSLLPRHLAAATDGRFEVLFGPHEQPGNWLKVVPGTSYLLTREFFADWDAASASELEIEAVDAVPGEWPVMSADRVAKELESLGVWLVETVRVFGGMQTVSVRDFANAFKPQPVRADSDLPTIFHGFWELAPDECLLIETPAPRADYWGFQLSNSVWNTLDFANRQTSLNTSQAAIDADGMIRLVVAATDPGVPNWLDTMGHRQGAIHVRLSAPRGLPTGERAAGRELAATVNDWMATWDEVAEPSRVPGHPVPQTRLLKLSDLPAALPATTPRITPEQRAAVLRERLRQVTRMQRA